MRNHVIEKTDIKYMNRPTENRINTHLKKKQKKNEKIYLKRNTYINVRPIK